MEKKIRREKNTKYSSKERIEKLKKSKKECTKRANRNKNEIILKTQFVKS